MRSELFLGRPQIFTGLYCGVGVQGEKNVDDDVNDKHNVKKQTIQVYFIVERLIEQPVLHNYIASVNNRMDLVVS